MNLASESSSSRVPSSGIAAASSSASAASRRRLGLVGRPGAAAGFLDERRGAGELRLGQLRLGQKAAQLAAVPRWSAAATGRELFR